MLDSYTKDQVSVYALFTLLAAGLRFAAGLLLTVGLRFVGGGDAGGLISIFGSSGSREAKFGSSQRWASAIISSSAASGPQLPAG